MGMWFNIKYCTLFSCKNRYRDDWANSAKRYEINLISTFIKCNLFQRCHSIIVLVFLFVSVSEHFNVPFRGYIVE